MQEQKTQNGAVARGDEELLASLGYKQEFRREFTGLEVRSRLLAVLSIPLTGLSDFWYSL